MEHIVTVNATGYGGDNYLELVCMGSCTWTQTIEGGTSPEDILEIARKHIDNPENKQWVVTIVYRDGKYDRTYGPFNSVSEASSFTGDRAEALSDRVRVPIRVHITELKNADSVGFK